MFRWRTPLLSARLSGLRAFMWAWDVGAKQSFCALLQGKTSADFSNITPDDKKNFQRRTSTPPHRKPRTGTSGTSSTVAPLSRGPKKRAVVPSALGFRRQRVGPLDVRTMKAGRLARANPPSVHLARKATPLQPTPSRRRDKPAGKLVQKANHPHPASIG